MPINTPMSGPSLPPSGYGVERAHLCLTPRSLPQAVARDEHTGLDDKAGQPVLEVALMFVSGEHGVLLQEYQSLDSTGEAGGRAGDAPRASKPDPPVPQNLTLIFAVLQHSTSEGQVRVHNSRPLKCSTDPL